MKGTVRLALAFLFAVVALLVVDTLHLVASASDPLNGVSRADYYKLHLEAVKAIGIGLIGILIPLIFTEARARFERVRAEARERFELLKESRIAYSNAKTGVDYLAIRLCALSLEGASALIQQVHVYKHQAELYPEVEVHLKRRGINLCPDAWGETLYQKLSKARKVLEDNAGSWDAMTPRGRLEKLLAVLPEHDQT